MESGGDNLTASFSKGLIDRQIFVVDVAGGDKVPRKGGPGVTRSDLLVINKIDLAPLVGADAGELIDALHSRRVLEAVRGDGHEQHARARVRGRLVLGLAVGGRAPRRRGRPRGA